MSAAVGIAIASMMMLTFASVGSAAAEPLSHASPSSSVSTASTVPDWQQLGFRRVLAVQVIPANTAAEVMGGPYKVSVPAGAFTDPVRFEILAGSAEGFQANAPVGQKPVLAFALRVIDLTTHQAIGKFAEPVVLTANSPCITSDSQYYNIAVDGTYTANPTGMSVTPGHLTHPIAADVVGWVITSPATSKCVVCETPHFPMFFRHFGWMH